MGSAESKATQRATKFKARLEEETSKWIAEERRRIGLWLTDPDYSDIYVLLPSEVEVTKQKAIDAGKLGRLEPIGKRSRQWGLYTWPAPKEGMLKPLAKIWDVTQSVVTGESGTLKVSELKRVIESTEEDDPAQIRKSVNWATLTERIVRGLNESANGVSRFEKWRSKLERLTETPKMYKMYMAYFDTPESTAVAMVGLIKRIFLAAVYLVQQHSHEHSHEQSQVPSGYANRLSIGA
jgi:hypothetical protein